MLEYLIRNKNCRGIGIDISDDAIQICRKKGIEAIKCDIETEVPPGKYDVIILSAVLEHLFDPISVLNKCRIILKREGSIIIGVPNFSHLLARIQYLLGRNIQYFDRTPEGRRLGIQPAGHIRFFNKSTLEYLLRKTGYSPVEWRYHRSQGMFGLYKINHPLFSVFIAVRAKKVEIS